MQPLNDSFSMSTFADLCGGSGVGIGPGGRGCNIFQPGTLDRHHAAVRPVRQRQSRLRDRLEQLRAERRRRRGGRTCRTAGSAPLLGDPDQATIRGRLLGAFTRERMDRFTNLYSANPGGADQRQPHRQPGQPRARRARAGRSRSASGTASGRRRSRLPRLYPLTPSLVNGDDINIFDPAIKVPNTRSWSIGLQRALEATWRSTSATSAPAS